MISDLLLETDLTKSGFLEKKGLGWLIHPNARRLFKLYGRFAILTYETEKHRLKGILHIEDIFASPIFDRDRENIFEFFVYVRKYGSNGEISKTRNM